MIALFSYNSLIHEHTTAFGDEYSVKNRQNVIYHKNIKVIYQFRHNVNSAATLFIMSPRLTLKEQIIYKKNQTEHMLKSVQHSLKYTHTP